MADAYVREIGRVEDMDGFAVRVGVDYDSVTLKASALPGPFARFTQHQAEEFAQLFVSAVWQAGANARQMAEETHEADGGVPADTRVLKPTGTVLALVDPDCRDGKHTSCVGAPCECPCHTCPPVRPDGSHETLTEDSNG